MKPDQVRMGGNTPAIPATMRMELFCVRVRSWFTAPLYLRKSMGLSVWIMITMRTSIQKMPSWK